MLAELFDPVYKIFNPLPPVIVNHLYPVLFLLNIFLVLYFLKNNTRQWKEIKGLMDRRLALLLVPVLLFAAANMIYCMNPDNNIPPVGTEIMLEAENYFQDMHFSRVARPLGISGLLIPAQHLPADITLLMSSIGIMLALGTIFIMCLAIKKLTNSNIISIMLAALYAFLSPVVYFSSSHVSGAVFSALAITSLVLLYVLKNDDPKTILYATTLTLFGRVENIVLVLVFIGYLFVKKRKIHWIHFLMGYAMLLPNIEVARYWPCYTMPYHDFAFGIDNLLNRVLSIFYQIQFNFFLLGILIFIGIICCRKRIIIWIPIALLTFLLFFQQYENVSLRYMVPLLPVFFILVSCCYRVISSYKNGAWLFVFILLVMSLGSEFTAFDKVKDHSYISESKKASEITSDDCGLLSYVDGGRYFSRFYDNITIIHPDLRWVPEGLDCMVLISEFDESEMELETRLDAELELIEEYSVTWVFSVEQG